MDCYRGGIRGRTCGGALVSRTYPSLSAHPKSYPNRTQSYERNPIANTRAPLFHPITINPNAHRTAQVEMEPRYPAPGSKVALKAPGFQEFARFGIDRAGMKPCLSLAFVSDFSGAEGEVEGEVEGEGEEGAGIGFNNLIVACVEDGDDGEKEEVGGNEGKGEAQEKKKKRKRTMGSQRVTVMWAGTPSEDARDVYAAAATSGSNGGVDTPVAEQAAQAMRDVLARAVVPAETVLRIVAEAGAAEAGAAGGSSVGVDINRYRKAAIKVKDRGEWRKEQKQRQKKKQEQKLQRQRQQQQKQQQKQQEKQQQKQQEKEGQQRKGQDIKEDAKRRKLG